MEATPTPTPAPNLVSSSLADVRARIANSCAACGRQPIQLIAVSKTKPIPLLEAAYAAGQRHFGENYVQELVTKAAHMPMDIKWHFIGALQSNKAKMLVGVPNLYMVESVDREKVARALDKAVGDMQREGRLKVMVQVNTSGEDSKSGCAPGETIELARFVDEECAKLELVGLMTIGAPDEAEEPVAFRVLREEREKVARELGRGVGELILSMGMSEDFERAIRMGSDSVRVGSTIFGEREYPKKE